MPQGPNNTKEGKYRAEAYIVMTSIECNSCYRNVQKGNRVYAVYTPSGEYTICEKHARSAADAIVFIKGMGK